MFDWLKRILILNDTFIEDSFTKLLKSVEKQYDTQPNNDKIQKLNMLGYEIDSQFRDYKRLIRKYMYKEIDSNYIMKKRKKYSNYISNTYNQLLKMEAEQIF